MNVDPLPFAVAVRAETTLEVAALVARLSDADIRSLHWTLASPDRRIAIVALVRHWHQLDAEVQDIVVSQLAELAGPDLHVV
jgi:hypothetical protein